MDGSGKRGLITGASSGIGAATAKAAAKRGAELARVARSADKLEAVARGIRQSGGRVTTHAFDVSDPEQVSRLAGEAPASRGLFQLRPSSSICPDSHRRRAICVRRSR
jgi:short-subunit dehydrogenase